MEGGRRYRGRAWDAFRSVFEGRLIVPGDPDYDIARAVWNGMVDRHPALVARCTGVADVVAALRFAREEGLAIAVRGGGHSVAGFSTCDGGMVIDLGPICGVVVDPERRVAQVGGGALLSQLDEAGQRFGLACPVGVVGHTGVGGLTLGGGIGRLQRKYGYTIDNLLGVDLVTADGALVHAGPDENSDLFWGLRGAGANYGIATSFRFRMHPVGPTIVHGLLVYPVDRAHDLAARLQELASTAPDDVSCAMAFAIAPGDPPFSPEMAGRAVVHLEITHCGPVKEAERFIHSLRVGSPLVDTCAPKSFLSVQLMSDEERAWGHRFYMKNAFLPTLGKDVVDIAADRLADARGDCGISFMAQGGAIARLAEDDTAFAGRHASFWCTVETLWDDPGRDEEFVGWARATMAALKPFTTAGSYVNDVAESGEDVVRAIYGSAKHGRLVALKQVWDPDNVFRLNQNIAPQA
jgi:hypothetical protein